MNTNHTPVVNIRYAKVSDDFLTIARCLYLTDPFIYPAAFGHDEARAMHAIVPLMQIDGNLFDYRRLIVATVDDQVKGVLMYSEQGITWNQNACDAAVTGSIPNLSAFQYVSQAYFSQAASISSANHIEIVACCVAPEARRHGLATLLFQYIIKTKPSFTMSLDVLASNHAAISLYSKFGFVVTNSYKGFSMNRDTLPDCYHMKLDTQ